MIKSKKYYLAKTKILITGWNTYIGGVSSTVNTASILATKLGISSSDIYNFTILGTDIKCFINVNYTVDDFGITNPVNVNGLTYYFDFGGKAIAIGNQGFYGSNLVEGYFPAATHIGTGAFDNNVSGSLNKLKSLYAPNVLTIGNTVGNDLVFRSGNLSGGIIYAHPSLQTINSGGVEGDLNYLSGGNTIRYVTDITAPNPVSDLTASVIYGTAVKLTFSTPSSTNLIEYYELWVNDNYIKRIVSGGVITELSLSTSYEIKVVSVDIYGNRSLYSNIINPTTDSSELYPTGSIVSYLKMENNVVDFIFGNNGNAANISYGTGVVGQTALFNGTSSMITISDSSKLSFSNGLTDFPFSGNVQIYRNAAPGANGYWYINKRQNTTTGQEWQLYEFEGQLAFILFSNNSGANYIQATIASPLSINTWHNITWTYSGSGTTSGLKIYLDGILLSTTNTMVGTYVALANSGSNIVIGRRGWNAAGWVNGKIDESIIFNKELTATEVSNINIKINSGQNLI